MKFFNTLFQEIFSERFSFFDVIAMLVFIELAKLYSFWWLLAIIPFSIISAALTMRTNKTKE
jgi:hypothetical protein